MNDTQETTPALDSKDLRPGQIVFFSQTEEYWDKQFVMKRHHTPETRSVILRGRVVEVKGNEFKAELFENNGFEKDGESFVFNKGQLLSNQDFTDFARLGQWKKN